MTTDPAIHVALAELMAEYFARVDRLVDRPVAELFAPDGRMRLGPLSPDGREAIAAYFADRRREEDGNGRKVRHLIANPVIERAEANGATIRFQCHVHAAVGEFPLPSAAPATIADFGADCVSRDGIWLIGELRGRTTFSGANAASFALGKER